MKHQVDTAVILAAGLGSRLGDIKGDKPKAFVKVGGQSLIERSIQLLISKGIKSIIIGTGYQSEQFDALTGVYTQIKTCKNPEYANTGSMSTLYRASRLVPGSFLLLEGDLLYEPAALDEVLEDDRPDIILGSGTTNSGDEVFIQVSQEGLLQNLSKRSGQLEHIDAELVGISKLTKSTIDALNKYAAESYRKNEFGIHYEDALVGISKEIKLHVKVVNDLAWCEIDDLSHLERAINVIYPKILNRTVR